MSVINRIMEKRAGQRLFTEDERPAEGHKLPRKSVDQNKGQEASNHDNSHHQTSHTPRLYHSASRNLCLIDDSYLPLRVSKNKIRAVNFLLEGIHLAAAMEATFLGACARVHPTILYDIISNAAGSSW
ncbi:hypothetical protein KSP40_PGU006848 [Platanthera guangdongensis]|uniref:Uncharacterized protein n=1 Tax=Platanthera guangdongensis TaxID=2320717 RepID=A0ABR2LNV2_9ASPA